MGGVVGRKGGAGLLQRKQSEKQQNKFPIRFEVETIRAVDHVLFSSCFFFFFLLFLCGLCNASRRIPSCSTSSSSKTQLSVHCTTKSSESISRLFIG